MISSLIEFAEWNAGRKNALGHQPCINEKCFNDSNDQVPGYEVCLFGVVLLFNIEF